MASSMTSIATAYSSQMTDLQNAQTIYAQVDAEAKKQEMSRWQILQDTQTKVFEIQQDVTVNKAKTQDKMFDKWDEYIRA